MKHSINVKIWKLWWRGRWEPPPGWGTKTFPHPPGQLNNNFLSPRPGSWARGELLFCDWCMESWQRICWDIPGLTVVTFLVTRPTCHDTLHLVTCRMLHATHVQTRCYTWFNRDRGGGYKSWYEYQRKISENKHVYNGNFNILASFMVIGMVGIVPIFYQINQICQCWKNLYNIR